MAFLLAAPATAETRREVSVAVDGESYAGVLCAPDAARPAPAVLVLHTSYGEVEPFDEDYARALAREGFVALAVNYMVRNERRWSSAITRRLKGMVGWLAARPEAAGKPVGVVGFSYGAQGVLLAAAGARIKALVVYYGAYDVRAAGFRVGPNVSLPIDVAAQVNAPALLLHGDLDDEIPVAIARRMERALKSAGKTAELVVYPGVHHRFDRGRAAPREGRAPSPSTLVYDEAATKDAWVRSLAWFKKYLGN